MSAFWIRINPAGCVVASTAALLGGTPDELHREHTPDPDDRVRETAAGWRHDLVDLAEWDERAWPCIARRCDHRLARVMAANAVVDGTP